MDYDITYDGQLNNWGPYANLGPPVVALPASDGKWVVGFYGGSSVSLQGNINGASWLFPDGQEVTSVVNSPFNMTFENASQGGSYFSLSVVDNLGASHFGRRLIFAVNDISEFPKVELSDIVGGTEAGGYQARIMAHGTPTGGLTEEVYPFLDNSEVVIFEQARYGANKGSVGGNFPYREETVFRGWVQNKELRVSPFSSDMFVLAQTVDGVMSQAESYDVFLANYQSGGSDWTEMQGLCLDGVAQFAMKWRSTLGDICDWHPAGQLATTETILYQSLPRGPFFNQIRQNYGDKGVLGFVASDMQSNIFAFFNEQVFGGSATSPVGLNIEDGDKREAITITNPPRDMNAQVKLYAVSSDIPYGAESPAGVRGYFGTERQHQTGLLIDSQERLVTWTGNYRAWLNNRYPRSVVPLATNMRVDSVPQSRVTMSMAASDNARGITWTNENFFTKETAITYDSRLGYPLIDLTLEKVVNGIGGSSITFPTVDDIVSIPTPSPDPGEIDIPYVPPVDVSIGTGFGTVYALIDDTLYRTRNFGAASPVWSDITPGESGLNDFILDPWNPAQIGFLLGNDGVYRSTNLDQSSPSWTQVISQAGIEALVSEISTSAIKLYKIVGSINSEGFFAFMGSWDRLTINHSGGCFFVKTGDRGETWSYSIIESEATGVGRRGYQNGGMDIVPHVVGGELVFYAATGRDTNGYYLHKSTDSGDTWSTLLSGVTYTGAPEGPCLVHCPYSGNENGTLAYWGVNAGNSIDYLWKYDGSNTSIGQSYTFPEEGGIKRWMGETYTQDENNVYQWEPWTSGGLLVSTNGGTSWSTVTTSGISASGTTYSSGGFPSTSSQFYLIRSDGSGNIKVYVSTDTGQNWSDKTGNISKISAEQNRTVIVPLWTE